MNNFIFVAFLTAVFFSSGLALPTPYDAESESSELNVPLLSADANIQAAITNETDSAAEIQAPTIPEPIEQQTVAASSSAPKSEQTPKKVINMKSAMEGAAANVYGGLPLDQQPKTIAEAAAKAKQTPAKLPADYDVNRVAECAAARVYEWLPEDKQPKAIIDAAEKAKTNVQAAITIENESVAEIYAPPVPAPIEQQNVAEIAQPTETGNEASIGAQSVPISTPQAEASPSAPKSEQTPKKVINMKSAMEGAAANVYGGLPLDQQPKTIAEAAAKAKQTPAKLPADYDVNRVAERAAARVYGWLPEDKQPKAIYDAAEKAKNTPKPPGDYDVERVAQKAARLVYGVLPIGMQPSFAGPSTDKGNVDDSEKSSAAAGDDDNEVEKEKKE